MLRAGITMLWASLWLRVPGSVQSASTPISTWTCPRIATIVIQWFTSPRAPLRKAWPLLEELSHGLCEDMCRGSGHPPALWKSLHGKHLETLMIRKMAGEVKTNIQEMLIKQKKPKQTEARGKNKSPGQTQLNKYEFGTTETKQLSGCCSGIHLLSAEGH